MDALSPYSTSPFFEPQPYQILAHSCPPSLTVLSDAGSVPSLYLLARVAGGGMGLRFGDLSGLEVSRTLEETTFHSLSNKVEW